MSSNKQMLKCYHCGLDVPQLSQYQVIILEQKCSMCCAGCYAVATAIVKNNLTFFYSQRTKTSDISSLDNNAILSQIELCDNDVVQQRFVRVERDLSKAELIIQGIVCPACIWLLEKHISALAAVTEFKINYSNHRASLVWDSNSSQLSTILTEILNIGYRGFPYDPSSQQKLVEQQHKKALWRIAIAALGSLQVMMFAIAMYAAEYDQSMDEAVKRLLHWVSLLFAAPVVVFSAQPFFSSAFRHLRQFKLGMDVPVALAIFLAFSASVVATISHHGEVYYDSVTMFTFLLLTGRYLEMRARHKAGYVAEQLLRMLPNVVTVISSSGHKVIALEALRLDDSILVKAGETIAADGIIEQGQSFIDEAIITGESRLLEKNIGSSVIAGSINNLSPIVVKVTKIAADTVLAGISRLLHRAQSQQPKIAKLADSIASWFVLVLLVLTVAIGIVWFIYDSSRVFEIVITVLVVTCPCALSLATPSAMTAVTGMLMRHGILTSRSSAIETLSKVSHVIFDKTGTLTYGQPRLVDLINYNDMLIEQVYNIAGSIARYSEHPLARELFSQYKKYVDYSKSITIQNYVGQGLCATIDNTEYILGNAMLIQQYFDIDCLEKNLEQKSVVFLAKQGQLIARFDFEDSLREQALPALALLQQLNIKTILLSGDNHSVTKKIARGFNFDSVHGNCSPEDKLNFIQALQKNNAVIAMIGDGINDAPVLAAADVSMAMGSATQLAQASAGMILLSNNLLQIPLAIEKSLYAMRIIKQNLLWAVIYNLIAIPLAAMGLLSPWMAALGMSLSSLLVVSNALRLTQDHNDKSEKGKAGMACA